MELGLHRQDAHQHLTENERQREEISALVWSIVILDRQWSAATGLPQNFHDSDFDQAIEPPVSESIRSRVAVHHVILNIIMATNEEMPI